MKTLYRFDTSKGPVCICQADDGRFHIIWKADSLGDYDTIAQAIDDAAVGHCWSPSDGTDLGSLGLSSDLSDWTIMRSASRT